MHYALLINHLWFLPHIRGGPGQVSYSQIQVGLWDEAQDLNLSTEC